MTNDEAAAAIERIISTHRGRCDCSLRETCERCNTYGASGRMASDLLALCEILRGRGEPPTPTIEDYYRSVKIGP